MIPSGIRPPNAPMPPGAPPPRGRSRVGNVLRAVGSEVGYFFLIPLAIGLIAAVLVGIYYVVQIGHQKDILNTFCRYEVRQDYLDAAEQFSLGYLGRTPANAFIQLNQQRDQQMGTVSSCSIAHNDYYLAFDHAQYTLQVKIGGKTYTGDTFLSYDGSWSIDSLDPGLHLDTP